MACSIARSTATRDATLAAISELAQTPHFCENPQYRSQKDHHLSKCRAMVAQNGTFAENMAQMCGVKYGISATFHLPAGVVRKKFRLRRLTD